MPEVAAVLNAPPAEAPVPSSSRPLRETPPSSADATTPESPQESEGQTPPQEEARPEQPGGEGAPSTNEGETRPLAEQVRQVADEVITQKIGYIDGKYSKMSAEEQRNIFMQPQHRGEAALLTLRAMEKLPGICKKLEGGLQVVIDGQPVMISGIDSYTDTEFTCTVKDSGELVTVSRQQVYDAQLSSEDEAILREFPEDSPQRAALELHIKTLREGEAALSDSAAVEATLTAASESLARGEETVVRSPEERMMEVLDNALKIFNMSAETGVVLVNDARTQEHVHALLRIANEANGEAGIIFRVHALTVLEQLKQIGQLKQLKLGEVGLAAKLANQAAAAKENLLTKLNLTPEERVALLHAGDDHEMLVGLIEKKMVGNEKGVSELIFGEHMSKEDLFKLLGQEKEKTSGGLLAMIIAYLFEELLIKPLTQRLS